jgi:hypothetical protein
MTLICLCVRSGDGGRVALDDETSHNRTGGRAHWTFSRDAGAMVLAQERNSIRTPGHKMCSLQAEDIDAWVAKRLVSVTSGENPERR